MVKYKGILNVLEAFLADHGVTRLSQLTIVLFDRFRSSRKSNHHRKTMYTEGVVVKQFLKWAKSRQLVADNPIAEYKLDKPPLEPKEGPSLQQIECVLVVLDEPTHTQIALLAFTGMRAGELRRLQPQDLDLAGSWLHVRSRPGLKTKTGLSRKVPIHARLRPMLAALTKRPRPWLFTSPPTGKFADGNQALDIKKLNEMFQTVANKLGLPTGRKKGGYTLHSLRHFFETFTVNAGIPQRVVDTWLGHGSDRSMAAVYYKLSDEDSQTFVTKVPFGTGVPAADAGKEGRAG